jgi:hypothetical protein
MKALKGLEAIIHSINGSIKRNDSSFSETLIKDEVKKIEVIFYHEDESKIRYEATFNKEKLSKLLGK